MSKETPWFPGEVKPAHVGLYQRLVCGEVVRGEVVVWAWWQGSDWCAFSTRKSEARYNGRNFVGSLYQCHGNSPAWRGLTTQGPAE